MEFLFRGKCQNGRWIESSSLCQEEGLVDLYQNDVWYSIVPRTLTQYVNQTDREGNKVFDGDILKFTSDGEDFLVDVFFDENLSAFQIRDVGYSYGESLDFLKECVVVGNKFDNPELLIAPKGEK